MADTNKTEKATPKKKSDERKKGNIFLSKDLINSIILLITLFLLKAAGGLIYTYILKNTSGYLSSAGLVDAMTLGAAQGHVNAFIVKTLVIVAPIAASIAVVSVIFYGVQTRFLFTTELIKFQFKRLNPIEGFKKFFSLRSAVELLKSLIKVAIIALVLYTDIPDRMTSVMGLYFVSIEQSTLIIMDIIYSIAIKISCVLIGFGVLDYVYQWWSFERRLMMSKQEVKDEFKQTEGDPKIKGKLRDLQRRAALRRMMKKVPTADVVIRNPTHYAVALAYEPKRNGAPVVVAKGVDYLALRIVAIAEEHGVVITENPPLARGLYQAAEVDQEIPPEFYQAVAQVLSFVYNLKKRNAGL